MQTHVPHTPKQFKGRQGVPTVSIGRDEGVVGNQVRLGNSVEQLVGDLGKGLFGVSSNDGVEGENIWVWGGVEGLAGIRK